MVVGLFFFFDPQREPFETFILFVVAVICLITLVFFTKKLADIGTGDDIEVSAKGIWAYTLILTPVFSLLLVGVSILAKMNRSFKQRDDVLKVGFSEVRSTISKTGDDINGYLANLGHLENQTPSMPQEQDTEDSKVATIHTEQPEYGEGLCDICGEELYSSGRYHQVDGKDIEVCLNCYDVLNAMKIPSQREQCFDYLIKQIKKNPQTRTYIEPILMSNQETAAMFEKFLKSPEGQRLFK